jgi:uncharacterized protein
VERRGDAGGERAGVAMPADLSMVVLGARDLPALRRYYLALGWPEQAGGSDSLSTFVLGGVALTLYPRSEPDGPEAGGQVTAGPETGGHVTAGPEAGGIEDRSAVTLVVRVGARDEVDAACSAAVRAGAHASVEPQDHPWGGRSGIVADPEGNRWEVLWVDRPAPPEPGALGTDAR